MPRHHYTTTLDLERPNEVWQCDVSIIYTATTHGIDATTECQGRESTEIEAELIECFAVETEGGSWWKSWFVDRGYYDAVCEWLERELTQRCEDGDLFEKLCDYSRR